MFSGQESKKGIKGGVDIDRGKSRREDIALSLRTKKRDEMLEKRRNLGENEEPTTPAAGASEVSNPVRIWDDNLTREWDVSLEELPRMVDLLRSRDMRERVIGTQLIRKLLSFDKQPPIDKVIQSSAIPLIVESLRLNHEPQLQFEAAWCLTNIASGQSHHTTFVIQSQAVPMLVELLCSPHDDIVEQAIWAVGNIAGDSPHCREYVLGLGSLEKLLAVATQPSIKINVLRTVVWALSNLCRGRLLHDGRHRSALTVLASLIHHYDANVVLDACWGIGYLADGSVEWVQRVIESGVVPRLAQLLAGADTRVQLPAIRAIANLVTGDDEQTQTVLNHGVLASFHLLLHNELPSIRKEVCWCISNIAAGTTDQIQALINSNVLPSVIEFMKSSVPGLRREATWTIANVSSNGTSEQVRYILELGAIQGLCSSLQSPDPKLVLSVLAALENILTYGFEAFGDDNPYSHAVMECGGVDWIEQLQNHPNSEVYNAAVKILETFFITDDDYTRDTRAPLPTAMFSGNVSDANQGNSKHFTF